MKKIILSLLFLLPLCVKAQTAFTVTTDGKQYSFPITSEITLTDNEVNIPDLKGNVVVDFEGEGWSDLIDSKQYGGPLLYGETGYGFTEDKDVYEWTELRTTLHSKISNSYGSWAYWNGGVAISNYHDSITVGSYTNQLSIPLDLQAHSGDNFAVAYGNTTLDFSDGEAREVKGLWVTNNCYFLNSLNYGDAYNTAATATTYVDVVFEGFDANGTSTGKVTKRLQNGKVSLMGWAYVDLSPLGSIASFSISYEASADQKGDYGINAPQYVAIDDIEISL